MSQVRLVTLTGAAGTGKTRLALELVSNHGAGPTPVHWTELAPLRDPWLVAPAVAEAIGAPGEVRTGDTAALARLLDRTPTLLVLDNCEHLVDACAELADKLLRECPALSILATSREALGVRGERAWLVPPLRVADEGAPADPGASEAVRLFVERARDVAPGFRLTPENAPAVQEICRRLDGIPLAIELAAARVKVLAPADIRNRLDDVFQLLTSGARTAVPRHRTLRAAIDWSHDLLIDEARLLFHRLAVFRGGFSLDAAERVGAGGALATEQILDLVARLVDRSLLDVREHHGVTRYAYLEAVRQYATQRLVESGEEAEVRRRHALYVSQLVEDAEPHLTGPERRVWVDRLHLDLDNIRSALVWTQANEPELHVRLVGKLWWFWFSTRHWAEGGRWIQEALTLQVAQERTPERAGLLFAAGALAALQARAEMARPALEEAVRLAEELGDDRLHAYALNYLGMTYAGEGREEAVELCARAYGWFRDNDDLYGLRLAALLLGSAALGRGDLEAAERWNREGVHFARLFGQNRELAVSLQNLSVGYIVAGRLDEAEALIREAMAASIEDPSYYFIANGVSYLGEIEAARGRPGRAVELLGAAQGVRDRIGAVPFPIDARRQDAVVRELRDQLGETDFARAWESGRRREPDRLVRDLAGDHRSEPAPIGGPDSAGVTSEAWTGALLPDDQGLALRVSALGPLVVLVDGVSLDADRWVYAKPRELLVFLLLHPQGGTREEVGAALWAGAARSNVKNSFHVTLHHLRKALGHPEWITKEGDRYRLDPALRYAFDADQFEHRARAILQPDAAADGHSISVLRSVLDLYRGELLEGDPVGRWIDDHRDRFRRLQVELTLALGTTLESVSPAEAADLYQRLALREALDEEVHRRLMTAWIKAGNRVAALRHYERVVELLKDELDAAPEPATVALYESMRAG